MLTRRARTHLFTYTYTHAHVQTPYARTHTHTHTHTHIHTHTRTPRRTPRTHASSCHSRCCALLPTPPFHMHHVCIPCQLRTGNTAATDITTNAASVSQVVRSPLAPHTRRGGVGTFNLLKIIVRVPLLLQYGGHRAAEEDTNTLHVLPPYCVKTVMQIACMRHFVSVQLCGALMVFVVVPNYPFLKTACTLPACTLLRVLACGSPVHSDGLTRNASRLQAPRSGTNCIQTVHAFKVRLRNWHGVYYQPTKVGVGAEGQTCEMGWEQRGSVVSFTPISHVWHRSRYL